KTPSSFWMEMALMSNGQIESRVFITSLSEEKIEAGRFVAQPEESPIRLSGDLSEKSPFRLLAEARWWGRDLFRELFGDGGTSERLEIGSLTSAELIEVQEGDWLCWEEGHW